jgi:catechol 2,3-dioxygenase-like lactoylglutathione lyase family enzyme
MYHHRCIDVHRIVPEEVPMSSTTPVAEPAVPSAPVPAGGRVQLALNVKDVDEAVAFYSRLFGVEPAKRRPGYANFAVEQPPLKLVLLENPEAVGRLNHLGVEVPSTDQVTAATQRLANQGLDTNTEDEVTCCFAVQDKVWVDDPDGAPWEIYTVLADAGEMRGTTRSSDAEDPCAGGACACG